jgi:hypothetical protein
LIQGEIVRLLWRLLILIALVGVLASLSSGLFENKPDFISIPENEYFGFPLVWRMLNTATGETRLYSFELTIDCLFWFALVSIVAVVAMVTRKSVKKGITE